MLGRRLCAHVALGALHDSGRTGFAPLGWGSHSVLHGTCRGGGCLMCKWGSLPAGPLSQRASFGGGPEESLCGVLSIPPPLLHQISAQCIQT